jgi:hypothetical protein
MRYYAELQQRYVQQMVALQKQREERENRERVAAWEARARRSSAQRPSEPLRTGAGGVQRGGWNLSLRPEVGLAAVGTLVRYETNPLIWSAGCLSENCRSHRQPTGRSPRSEQRDIKTQTAQLQDFLAATRIQDGLVV